MATNYQQFFRRIPEWLCGAALAPQDHWRTRIRLCSKDFCPHRYDTPRTVIQIANVTGITACRRRCLAEPRCTAFAFHRGKLRLDGATGRCSQEERPCALMWSSVWNTRPPNCGGWRQFDNNYYTRRIQHRKVNHTWDYYVRSNISSRSDLCHRYSGRCVAKDGARLSRNDTVNNTSITTFIECLDWCMTFDNATGCELWGDVGCYVLFWDVDHGDRQSAHWCWALTKCGTVPVDVPDLRPGYWGLPTRCNRKWCEKVYEVSPYVAEFWNTISNLPFFIIAIFGLARYYQDPDNPEYPKGTWTAYCMLWLIGIGSSFLHMTQMTWAGYMDEIPMTLLPFVWFFMVKDSVHVAFTTLSFIAFWIIIYAYIYCIIYDGDYFLVPGLELLESSSTHGMEPDWLLFKCVVIYAIVGALISLLQAHRNSVCTSEENWIHLRESWLNLLKCLLLFGSGFYMWHRDDIRSNDCKHLYYVAKYYHALWHILAAGAATYGTEFCISFTKAHLPPNVTDDAACLEMQNSLLSDEHEAVQENDSQAHQSEKPTLTIMTTGTDDVIEYSILS